MRVCGGWENRDCGAGNYGGGCEAFRRVKAYVHDRMGLCVNAGTSRDRQGVMWKDMQ